MSLSKCPSPHDSLILQVAIRIQAPWAELAEDVLLWIRGYACLESDSQAQKKPHSCACLESDSHAQKKYLESEALDGNTNEKSWTINLKEKYAWAVALAAMGILVGPTFTCLGGCWVTFGGLQLPLKLIFGSASVAMFAGACAVLKQFGETTEDQKLQRRWVIGLLVCGGIHFALFLGTSGSCLPVAMPKALVHYLKDFIVNPLLVANLGNLAGLSSKESLQCSGLSVFSSLGLAVIAAVSKDLHTAVDESARALAPPPSGNARKPCRTKCGKNSKRRFKK